MSRGFIRPELSPNEQLAELMREEWAQPNHVWVNAPLPVGPWLPRCKYCDTHTLQAQIDQPSTRGAGPCLKRPG